MQFDKEELKAAMTAMDNIQDQKLKTQMSMLLVATFMAGLNAGTMMGMVDMNKVMKDSKDADKAVNDLIRDAFSKN